MIRIETIKENIEQSGNVMNCNDFGKSDLDSILKRLDRAGAYQENIIFASPWFFEKIKAILDFDNAMTEGVSYGTFKVKENNPFKYLVDISFRRGTYEFHVIAKPIEESYIIPTYPKEESYFYRNCVLIRQDK